MGKKEDINGDEFGIELHQIVIMSLQMYILMISAYLKLKFSNIKGIVFYAIIRFFIDKMNKTNAP